MNVHAFLGIAFYSSLWMNRNSKCCSARSFVHCWRNEEVTELKMVYWVLKKSVIVSRGADVNPKAQSIAYDFDGNLCP